MTSGSLRNQCEFRFWMHFSCTQVIYLKRNRAENVFLVLIFQSSGFLPLYTDMCIVMLINKDCLDQVATCRSQANVVMFAAPGVILQWGEACGSPQCPAWGGGCLRSRTIWLRDALRHPGVVLCLFTDPVFGCPGPRELRGGLATDCRRMRVSRSLVLQVNEVTCRVHKSCGKWFCPWEISLFHVED